MANAVGGVVDGTVDGITVGAWKEDGAVALEVANPLPAGRRAIGTHRRDGHGPNGLVLFLKFPFDRADVRFVALRSDARRGARALVVSVLVALVVIGGAVPAGAGPGPGGSGHSGRAGAGTAGGERGEAARAAAHPVPGRKGAQPAPRKAAQPAPRKAASAQSARPRAGAGREDAHHRRRSPERREVAVQGHHVDGTEAEAAPAPAPRPSPPAPEPAPGVRPASAEGAARFVATAGPRRAVRSARQPASAAPDVAVANPDPPAPAREILAAGAFQGGGRPLWPALPGPVNHPAFPGLLGGALLAVAALACRGDRSDPKLAEAVVDDRDERASFR